MNGKNNSRFFHHYIPKVMPCVIPSISSPISCVNSSTYDDHILNLSASMRKHCPPFDNTPKEEDKESTDLSSIDISSQVESSVVLNLKNPGESERENVDMNCNDIKDPHREMPDSMKSDSSSSSASEPDQDRHFDDNDCDDPLTEIDVDDSFPTSGDNDSQEGGIIHSKRPPDTKKSKSLTFGIDRILSFAKDDSDKDEKPPTSPSSPVVSIPSRRSPNCTDARNELEKYKHQESNHSILSKLKLCATTVPSETQRRQPPGLGYFHHSYNPFHHPPHHHVNSVITSPSGGGIHNLSSHHHQPHHHNHQHPLSHCAECLFLRRYSGGNSGATSNGSSSNRTNINIPSSSSSSASANNVAANTMQFSTSMATPCGPSSSAISASFTWMANPSIYDNSAIISPVAGFNQHVPLQPSFALGATGFSSLATMQQCNSGGSSGRRKRSWSRAVFSNLQRKGLEKRFQLQKYITKPDRRQLAGSLGLTDAQVKVWFQNRRMKWRHSKEGKVSSGTGEATVASPSSSPVTSTTSTKIDGAIKDKK